MYTQLRRWQLIRFSQTSLIYCFAFTLEWFHSTVELNPKSFLNMTKPVNRKTGKKGHGDSAKNSTSGQAAKSAKKHSLHHQETSRKWMIVAGIACLLIGAVVVVMYVAPSLQVAFKQKASTGKDFAEKKKVVKDDGVRGRKGNKKSAAGKTGHSAKSLRYANDFSTSVTECDTSRVENNLMLSCI